MNENIRQFLENVAQSEELTAKLSACKTPDEAYALASSLQGGFTKEEFVAAMDKLSAAAADSDVSDEDLKKLAGGGTEGYISAGASAALSGAVTCASAAAAI